MVRYGEVGIKSSRTRARFEKMLISNIGEALRRYGIDGFDISMVKGRIVVRGLSGQDAVKAACNAARVFGVVSTSPSFMTRFKDLNELATVAYDIWRGYVKDRTFAVRVNRVGEHPFTSLDVARRIGAVLYPFSRGVDLDNPEVEVFVEIRDDHAFLYNMVIEGPGGLPLGSQGGKVLALVSGGFDSPVAYWLMMRRGALADALFCSLAPPIDVAGFVNVFRRLYMNWIFGYDPLVYIADCTKLVEEIRAKVNPHFMNIVFKRFLYRLAESITLEGGYEGIVTGESLGQVSSQTLSNLYSASSGISVPIYRPLIGMDKDDIVRWARRIGTYEESASMIEPCSVFSKKPRTRSTPEALEAEFSKVSKLVEEVKAGLKVFRASELEKVDARSIIRGGVGAIGCRD